MIRSPNISFLALFLGIFALNLAWASPPRPNIVFILTDDLGYGDLGVFWQAQRRANNDRSKPWHSTPNLDRLAAEGLTLPHHYCAAPVCAPSRASLLSGLHQGHANVRDNQFDKALEDNHTLATVLKAAGYATSCIGKWGLAGDGPAFPAHPLNRGFDDFFGIIRHVDGHDHYPKEGPYKGPKEIFDNRENVTATLDKCYTTDLFTARAKHWIQHQHKTTPTQPFFLYLAYATPHAVLELPTQAYPTGGGLKGGLKWIGAPGPMINTATGVIDSWIHPDYATATWDHDRDPATPEVTWPNVYQRYATSVRRIDDCVGDLHQLLKDLQIDRETLIVFTSDNGPSVESYLKESYSPEFFGSYGPFSGIKRDVWEGGIRVGAIAHWPDSIPAGRSSSFPCAQWDWLPTFAELAGMPCPARADGQSLVPTLTNRGIQKASNLYIEYKVNGITPAFNDFPPSIRGRPRGQMQMMRKDDFTALRLNITDPNTEFEVFNIVKDPQQSSPLLEQRKMDDPLTQRRPLPDARRPYDDSLIPSVTTQNLSSEFLNFTIYQGEWPWLPNFDSLQPSANGKDSSLNPRHFLRTQPHGLRLKGYFIAPKDGKYTFYFTSPNRTQLRLHHALLIDHDFRHPSDLIVATAMLKAGPHPICLDTLFTNNQDRSLLLEFSGPDILRQSIMNPIFCAASAQ